MSYDLAYAAGLFDGEGCLGIYKHNNPPGIVAVAVIAMTDKNVLVWMQERFGGKLHDKPVGSNRDTAYVWRLGKKKDIVAFLIQVLPFLKTKRAHATIMLAFCAESNLDNIEKYTAVMKALNRRGPGATILKDELARVILK